MSCPEWKECFHKECQEDRECCNASFWADYWKRREDEICNIAAPKLSGLTIVGNINIQSIDSSTRPRKKDNTTGTLFRRIANFKRNNFDCPSGKSYCDKPEACSILSQCILTISRFQGKPALLQALRGGKTIKQVIRILAKHDPKPMASYYMHQKKKK